MSLLDLARKVKEEYNPQTDKINASGPAIQPGEYEVVISDCGYGFSEKSGWESVVIECTIMIGEYAQMKESVRISFIEEWKGKKIPEFILSRNIKMAQKLAYLANIQMYEDDWEDTRSIANALKPIVGTQALLMIDERPNNNDPSRPYRLYEFEELGDSIELEEPNAVNVSDDDLPF